MQNKTAWEIVKLARHSERPTAKFVIETLFADFIELRGDRLYANDKAIIGGIGSFNGLNVTVIAEEKGTCLEEKIQNRFGMPNPDGYRKAMRLVAQAEKFNRPVLMLIDTPGAYPGVEAENRGQAQAIAMSLRTLSQAKVPIIGVVLSEGGSGGALAIGITDYLLMFENATYAILSPEGFAAILYKDASLAETAASDMKITAQDLFGFGIVDEIIPEVSGGWHKDRITPMQSLKKALSIQFERLLKTDIKELTRKRYDRYRAYGTTNARGFDNVNSQR